MAHVLSRNTKLVIGAALIVPFVWGAGLTGAVLVAATSGTLASGLPPSALAVMFLGHLVAVLAALGAWVWSLVHAASTPRLTSQQRTLWIVLMAVFSTLAAIPYFFLHVWPEP